MNNYYFTESKWYGPIENGIDFNNDDEAQEYYLSLPSGPSTIPQFAGMVKEEGKDFAFEIHWNRNKGRSMPTHADLDKIAVPLEEEQTAVPVAEEKLSWQEEVIAREEEGNKDRSPFLKYTMNGNRTFYVDEVRKWLRMYDKGEISFSKFVEMFNEKVFDKYHKLVNAEEGKQTFSEEDIVKYMVEARSEFVGVILKHFPHEQKPKHTSSAKTWTDIRVASENILIAFDNLLTQYLKTKQ